MKKLILVSCILFSASSISFAQEQWQVDNNDWFVPSDKNVILGTSLSGAQQTNSKVKIGGGLSADYLRTGLIQMQGDATTFHLSLLSFFTPSISISPSTFNLNAVTGSDFVFKTGSSPYSYQQTTKMTLTNAGRLGLGSTNPEAKFEVRDASNASMRLYSTNASTPATYWSMNGAFSYGFGIGADNKGHIFQNVNSSPQQSVMTFQNDMVGIGTDNPESKLNVKDGQIQMNKTNHPEKTTLNNTSLNFTTGQSDFSLNCTNAYNVYNGLHINPGTSAGERGFHMSPTGRVTLGKVASNSADVHLNGSVYVNGGQSYKIMPEGYIMAIDGNLICEEVRVKMSEAWGDFVFDDSYKLMPISELKEFTETHKHLPEIPKADVIESEGADVGEMARLQMIKIEELTRYIIQQQDEIDELRELINVSK